MMTTEEFDSPVHLPSRMRSAKDILVCGDVTEDVTDIVEKFIKVAHGPEAIENNRARENARENIRKKLAMEAGKEKSDSCDLQVGSIREIRFSFLPLIFTQSYRKIEYWRKVFVALPQFTFLKFKLYEEMKINQVSLVLGSSII